MPRATLIILGLSLPLLTGCVPSNLDFDLRPDRISTRTTGEAAPRPAPDASGLISYDSYQMVVARRGDTVADVAARIGMQPEELASFNGRSATDSLRPDEVLALPRPVTPRAGGNADITAIASSAIAAAEARQPLPASALPTQPGQEPVRHRVGRGETAYSVARLYNVSVRSLAEWNGLGPDLAVREGQYLIIPIILEQPPTPALASAPGASVAPLPPSAATPLPAPIEQAPRPAQTTQAAAPAPAAAPAATPAPPAPQATRTARFIQPVSGSIIRPFGNGNEGIDIGAATGTPVRAAGDGEVAAITQDTDQIPILVVRHPDGLLTVYANIRNITVSRGDRVTQGQTIAQVGGGDPPFLHFEVRRGFEAENPTRHLP
jgi:lipoprotein NlpD